MGNGWFVSAAFSFQGPDTSQSGQPNPDYWTFEPGVGIRICRPIGTLRRTSPTASTPLGRHELGPRRDRPPRWLQPTAICSRVTRTPCTRLASGRSGLRPISKRRPPLSAATPLCVLVAGFATSRRIVYLGGYIGRLIHFGRHRGVGHRPVLWLTPLKATLRGGWLQTLGPETFLAAGCQELIL